MKNKLSTKLNEYISNHLSVIEKTNKTISPKILEIAKLISNVIKKGNKILICGNGGSASDSQHIATEFMSTLTQDTKRCPIPAIALTTDTSFLTAYSNDFNFDNLFSRQVEGLGKKGDVLIGISTSGNSKNIINAIRTGNALKLKTILFTGIDKNSNIKTDLTLNVQSNNTQHIQEAHITFAHIIIEMIEFHLGYRK